MSFVWITTGHDGLVLCSLLAFINNDKIQKIQKVSEDLAEFLQVDIALCMKHTLPTDLIKTEFRFKFAALALKFN